mmetsp:Transcript_71674/g.186853  ORF Transcript_71674/g.186853 Transcript_71674/m.186853 type:complete len:227 (-) Transcript_71674:638-1318(-)
MSSGHRIPLDRALTPFVWIMASPLCAPIAASMDLMPPTSAKDWSPAQRLPTKLDMASMPPSCTTGSPMCFSMSLVHCAMAPASVISCGSSCRSNRQNCFASPSHPAAVSAEHGSPPAAAKRCATCGGSTTSLRMSCPISSGRTACSAHGPPRLAARKRPERAPGPLVVSFGVPFSPVGCVSAATMRASASLAFTPTSFGSGCFATAVTRADRTSGTASLARATLWS